MYPLSFQTETGLKRLKLSNYLFLPLERTDFTCEYKHTIYNKINMSTRIFEIFIPLQYIALTLC